MAAHLDLKSLDTASAVWEPARIEHELSSRVHKDCLNFIVGDTMTGWFAASIQPVVSRRFSGCQSAICTVGASMQRQCNYPEARPSSSLPNSLPAATEGANPTGCRAVQSLPSRLRTPRLSFVITYSVAVIHKLGLKLLQPLISPRHLLET